jgi:hypothetical protein
MVNDKEDILRQSFNAREFLAVMADAYDRIIKEEKATTGIDFSGHGVFLKRIHKQLPPRRAWPGKYTQADFIYDIHLLFISRELYLPDGRRYFIYSSRDARNNLSIPDHTGREARYAAIEFRRE